MPETGFCAAGGHNECPDSIKDTGACSCPCHLKDDGEVIAREDERTLKPRTEAPADIDPRLSLVGHLTTEGFFDDEEDE